MGILMRTTPISSTLLLTLVAAMVGNPASGFHFPLPAGTARVGPAVTVCMAGRATRGSRGGARGGQTSWGRRAGETGEGGGGGWRGAQGASGSRGARGARGGRLVADEMPLEGDGRMVPNRGWNDREKVEDMIRMRQGTIEELTVEAMEARLQTKLFGKKKDWKEIQEASKGKLRADRSAARASTRTAAGTGRVRDGGEDDEDDQDVEMVDKDAASSFVVGFGMGQDQRVAKELGSMDRLERRLIADGAEPESLNAKRLLNDIGLPKPELRRALRAFAANATAPTALATPALSREASAALARLALWQFSPESGATRGDRSAARGETVSVERAAVVKALGEEGEGLVAALEALPRGLDPDGCPAAFKRLDLSFRKLAPPGYPFERLAVGNADYVATVPLNDQNDGVEGGTPAAICNGGVLTPPERVVGEALVRSGDVCAGARRVVAGAALDLVITFHYRRGL